jgi:acyl-coenzyme A synthetase/AMP-(fatty) acid ligase
MLARSLLASRPGKTVVSAVVSIDPAEALPLVVAGDPARPLAWRQGRAVSAGAFVADAHAVAATLPSASHVLNLCEDRYAFLVGFCAAILRGQTSLLPHSRAPEVIADTLARYPDSYCLIDHDDAMPPRRHRLHLGTVAAPAALIDRIEPQRVVAVGFTSGSTGAPKANAKTWGGFAASNARNAALLGALAHADAGITSVVATVPPQHMYGMELSVLLPLLGPFAVHTGRPFFPAEVVAALAEVPAPRVLVTTPVHLRALLRDGVTLPPLAGIVSATAPLPVDIARAAEQATGAVVLEMFGSTETCVIAHRRTACDDVWQLYDDVSLQPQPDGTVVDAPWFAAPLLLQDIVSLQPPRGFRLAGRNADLLEIAGKRASLGELTQRVLALSGVEDAAVFQSDALDASGVRRIAALVVAPGRSSAALLAELRRAVDPVFLPRPLKCVDRLPRNATGKLPRAALLAMLAEG